MINNQVGYKSFVKIARDELQLTQAELAEKLGVSVVTVNRWENGKRKPSIETLNDLSFLLSIKPSDLLKRTEDAYVDN